MSSLLDVAFLDALSSRLLNDFGDEVPTYLFSQQTQNLMLILPDILNRLHFQQCSCNATQIFLERKWINVPKSKELRKEQPSHVRIEGTSGESAHWAPMTKFTATI
jgi:hypothetical protein